MSASNDSRTATHHHHFYGYPFLESQKGWGYFRAAVKLVGGWGFQSNSPDDTTDLIDARGLRSKPVLTDSPSAFVHKV